MGRPGSSRSLTNSHVPFPARQPSNKNVITCSAGETEDKQAGTRVLRSGRGRCRPPETPSPQLCICSLHGLHTRHAAQRPATAKSWRQPKHCQKGIVISRLGHPWDMMLKQPSPHQVPATLLRGQGSTERWYRPGIENYSPPGQTWPPVCFLLIKFYWDMAMPIRVHVVYSGFPARTAELRNCDRECLGCRVDNSYSLAFYKACCLLDDAAICIKRKRRMDLLTNAQEGQWAWWALWGRGLGGWGRGGRQATVRERSEPQAYSQGTESQDGAQEGQA